jgi:Cytochrome C'
MNRILASVLLGTVLVLGLAAFVAHSQEERPLSPAKEVMWRKLDLSHDTLDALALDDFEAMEAYAEDLESLSRAEAMVISDSEEFRAESAQFQRAARDLRAAARARSSEAAALAYVDLTLRCVGCHRLLGALPQR